MLFHHLISRLNEELRNTCKFRKLQNILMEIQSIDGTQQIVRNTCKFSEVQILLILRHIHKSYVFKYKDVHVPISNFRHFGVWKSMSYFVEIRNMLYSDIKFCNISRNRMCSNRNMSVFLFQIFRISKYQFSCFIFPVLIVFAKVISLISLCLF